MCMELSRFLIFGCVVFGVVIFLMVVCVWFVMGIMLESQTSQTGRLVDW